MTRQSASVFTPPMQWWTRGLNARHAIGRLFDREGVFGNRFAEILVNLIGDERVVAGYLGLQGFERDVEPFGDLLDRIHPPRASGIDAFLQVLQRPFRQIAFVNDLDRSGSSFARIASQ